MTSPAAFLAPLLLLFGPPSPAQELSAPLVADTAVAPWPSSLPGWIAFDAIHATPMQHQVRIEQRVIIRISPRSATARQSMSSLVAPPNGPRTRLVERKADDCLPIAAIGAVQPARHTRLMLFMRDRRLFSAQLERSCTARDFYSGFYVERNDDGMICIDRDELQSRTGSKCEVERLHQVVAAAN